MKQQKISGLIYQSPSPVDLSLKIVLAGCVVIDLAIAIWLSQVDITGTWLMLGTGVFLALLFYFIFPKKYQVYEDRIKIVLGGPFAINVPFVTIKEIRPAPAVKGSVYGGIKFVTNSKNIVEIVRKKGMGIIISPADRDTFLQQVNQAMANYAKMNPDSNN
jgi:hypothetical protein